MMRRPILLFGTLAVLAFAAGPAWAVQYTITDLGIISGAGSSYAYGVNSSGQVTGSAAASVGTTTEHHPFLWDSGTMIDLGVIGTPSTSSTSDINNAGTVVGGDFSLSQPFATIGNTTSGMQSLLGGSVSGRSLSCAINNNGIVTGEMQVIIDNEAYYRAFAYDVGEDELTDIGGLSLLASSFVSVAEDINDHDEVVGWGYGAVEGEVPFLYDDETLTDLRTVITGAKTALIINDDGWIVGDGEAYYFPSGAYLHNGTTSVDLGQLNPAPTNPEDMNNNGLVVGYSESIYDEEEEVNCPKKAFLYDNATGTISSLYDLLDAAGMAAWTSLTTANAVNDAGQIVGTGKLTTGETRAFLMTPVPEPSAVCLAVLGLAGLVCYAWRKRE